jgi:hypothetical protein
LANCRESGGAVLAQFAQGRLREKIPQLVIASHVLTDGTVYCDLGGNSFAQRDRQAVERRLVRRLEGWGSTVSLDPAAGAAGERYFQTRLS